MRPSRSAGSTSCALAAPASISNTAMVPVLDMLSRLRFPAGTGRAKIPCVPFPAGAKRRTDFMIATLIDIGINLAHDSYDADRQQVIERARTAGVGHMIVTGSSIASTR